MLVELTKYKEKSLFTTQIKWSLPLVLIALGIFAYTMKSNLFGAAAPVALSLPPDLTQGLSASAQNAQMVSRGLFAGFLLPLEILSVILLVALVGALVLAKSERVS
jgi:NADH:ubiquinone oxidoreductase subunit 6 (subunit J)